MSDLDGGPGLGVPHTGQSQEGAKDHQATQLDLGDPSSPISSLDKTRWIALLAAKNDQCICILQLETVINVDLDMI